MDKKILSPEWMAEYAKLWNDSPITRKGTADLTMVATFRLKEDPDRAGQIHVVAGEAVYGGAPVDGTNETFVLTAKLDTWRRLGDEELGPKSAIMLGHVKMRGPVKVAFAHLDALEESMRFFGRVDDTVWEA